MSSQCARVCRTNHLHCEESWIFCNLCIVDESDALVCVVFFLLCHFCISSQAFKIYSLISSFNDFCEACSDPNILTFFNIEFVDADI